MYQDTQWVPVLLWKSTSAGVTITYHYSARVKYHFFPPGLVLLASELRDLTVLEKMTPLRDLTLQ